MTLEQILEQIAPIPPNGETAKAYASIRREKVRKMIEEYTTIKCKETSMNVRTEASSLLVDASTYYPEKRAYACFDAGKVSKKIENIPFKKVKPEL
jgi:hypothetical protein